MTIHNNISPLPFYTDINEQHHRRSYAYGQVHPVISENNRILPFQFIIDLGGRAFSDDFNTDFIKGGDLVNIASVQLFNITSGAVIDLASYQSGLGAQGLFAKYITSDKTMLLVRHRDTTPLSAPIPPGQYYMEIKIDGVGSVFSDVFSVCDDLSNHIKLEYRNTHDLDFAGGYIDFSGGFKFRCYIDAEIGKPDYSFEEEATARMGYTFIESQVSKKTYRFAFPGTEEMCDALRIVRLCNQKLITTKHKTYRPLTFSMSANWEDQGDLATVECEFEVDNVIQNLGNLKQ